MSLKRIAVVLDTFPRWSERFIARELNELLDRGVEFTIFCLNEGDHLLNAEPDFQKLIPRRFVLSPSILPLGLREKSATREASDRFAMARDALGLPAYAKLRCTRSLCNEVKRGNFECIYAHFASLPSTIGWIAAAESNLPLLFSFHARDLFVEAQLLKQKIEVARGVFVCHARALEHVRKTGAGNKARLMHHGLPLEKFEYTRRKALHTPGKLRILAAARFVQKKGFDLLVDALVNEAVSSINFEVLLVGDGPERDAVERHIHRVGLGSKISLHEPMRAAALREAMNNADVFIAPYRAASDGDSDGVSNTVLEAFALGVPVISTQSGGMCEVVSTRTAGVVNPVNTQSLATAIAMFNANRDAAWVRTEIARGIIEEHFDLRKNIQPLLNFSL